MAASSVSSLYSSAWGAETAAPAEATETLRSRLNGRLYTPSDPSYDLARRGLGTTPVDDRFPALVVMPDGAQDIARTLEYAQLHSLDISVRSGGHDIFGASTTGTGVVIDLSRMDAVIVDSATGIARAGAGARAATLNAAAAQYERAAVLGVSSHLGLGGVTLGGGIGWLCGKYGAAVDNVLAAELVTADGKRLQVNAHENSDLFWAIRGGGGNFGVVTSFTYQLQPVNQVLAGRIVIKEDVSKFLRFWRGFLAQSPDELDASVAITLGSSPGIVVGICWSGTMAEGEQVLRPLREFSSKAIDDVKPRRYVAFSNPTTAAMENLFWRGGEIDFLNDRAIEVFASIADRGGPEDCTIGILHYMHGALCRIPAESTPLLRPEGHILYNLGATWRGTDHPKDKVDWVLNSAEILNSINNRQTYINYLSYQKKRSVPDAYGINFRRLNSIKRKYDPGNLFHNNRNIKTL